MDPRFNHNMMDMGTSATAADTEDPIDDGVPDLDCLKDYVQKSVLAIKRGKEPLVMLQYVMNAMKHAAETDRMGSDADFAEYVNTTLGLRLMSLMTRERSADDQVSVLDF